MSAWIVVSARMASARYPGKALVPLAGRPLLEVLLQRMKAARGVAGVALATSIQEENTPLAELARHLGVVAFRGPEDDVLRRYVDCAHALGARHVVRVTADNPLTDLETLEALVALHLAHGADYTYVPGPALLMGILSEVISTAALERSWERGQPRHRSELTTLYIKENPQEFRIETGTLPDGLLRPYRLTVDEPEDVALVQELFARLAAPGHLVSTREAIALLDRAPELAALNAHLTHKAHNLRSVALDEAITNGATEPQRTRR
ncbi:MAG TPA: glycosyltransferase family protein [Vicinamibacteria bacterium]|nr:glycosyltransferase family protein [Vicinamibacteria bacterium]